MSFSSNISPQSVVAVTAEEETSAEEMGTLSGDGRLALKQQKRQREDRMYRYLIADISINLPNTAANLSLSGRSANTEGFNQNLSIFHGGNMIA